MRRTTGQQVLPFIVFRMLHKEELLVRCVAHQCLLIKRVLFCGGKITKLGRLAFEVNTVYG